MTQLPAIPGARTSDLYRAALVVVAIMLLFTGFTGRAGVQVVDSAVAMRLFALHLHGVPGEEQYVQATGAPAPFVHPHCHAPLVTHQQPDASQVLAASTLAGTAICTSAVAPVAAPAAVSLVADAPADAPLGWNPATQAPPPKS